jgi:hypothetical protein
MIANTVISDAIRKRAPDDPNYNPNDSAMKQIHCRI